MTPVRAICFDLYGTLNIYGDDEAGWDAFVTELHAGFASHGLAMDAPAFREAFADFRALPEPPVAGDGLTVFERRVDRLARKVGLTLSAEALHDLAPRPIEAWHDHILPDPEAERVLADLRGRCSLALVSNFDHGPHVHALLDAMDVRRFFAAVVVSGDIEVRKPDPAIFEHALRALGARPEETVHVGDDWECDVLGARAAGIRPVWLDRDGLGGHDDAESIRRLSDLSALIR